MHYVFSERMASRLPIDDLIDALSPTQSSSSSVHINSPTSRNENCRETSMINNQHAFPAPPVTCVQNNITNTTNRIIREDSMMNVVCLSSQLDNQSMQNVDRETMPQENSLILFPNEENNERPTQFIPANHNLTPRSYLSRLRFITKNLSSSSLRKHQHKPLHCYFCPRFKFNASQLENHLEQSPVCLNLYLRRLHVNELLAVLVKVYRCMSCSSQGSYQLKRHLESNENCFQHYKNKLNVLDWNQIKIKIINLTRPSNESRSSARRRLSYVEAQNRRNNLKTVTEGLNAFKRETCLGTRCTTK